MYLLDENIVFPPVRFADDSGVLAIGGDLSVDRLKLAYSNGICKERISKPDGTLPFLLEIG